MQTTETQTEGVADLERLAAEVTTRGLDASVRTLAERLPYLDVRNPRASALAEKVYVQGDSFWWSWAERIGGCEDVTGAAEILARVLGTAGE